MNNIYIDESGSLCHHPRNEKDRYFYIGLVKVNDIDRVQKRIKKFIARNLKELKRIDDEHLHDYRGNKHPSCMFTGKRFKELKGSVLTQEMKFKFIDHMCVDHLIKIYLIRVDNTKMSAHFLEHSARAFNYILKTALTDFHQEGLLNGKIYLHIDNRNVKSSTLSLLEEYLNTELVTAKCLYDDIRVSYYHSETNALIQLADIVVNFFYSSQFVKEYEEKIEQLKQKNYIERIFHLPEDSLSD